MVDIQRGTDVADLPSRLRQLRVGFGLSQAALAKIFGVSGPSVSSWETGSAAAGPPEERLSAYAQLFATNRSLEGGSARLLALASFSEAEETSRQRLLAELVALRDAGIAADVAESHDGAAGGRFWQFDDNLPIRILTTRLSDRVMGGVHYANPWHPNYIRLLRDGDADSTLELFGHIRANNPRADVRFRSADQALEDDFTGHVVILGQGDVSLTGDDSGAKGQSSFPSALEYMVRRLELPVHTRLPAGADEEYDSEFVVTLNSSGAPTYYPAKESPPETEIYRPVFLRDEEQAERPRLLINGFPQLEYDVALLARRPNVLNPEATITVCSGIFSRGTYGSVRTLTDSALRQPNEEFLTAHLDIGNFWILFRVPVFTNNAGARTVTPAFAREFHRLRSSRVEGSGEVAAN